MALPHVRNLLHALLPLGNGWAISLARAAIGLEPSAPSRPARADVAGASPELGSPGHPKNAWNSRWNGRSAGISPLRYSREPAAEDAEEHAHPERDQIVVEVERRVVAQRRVFSRLART